MKLKIVFSFGLILLWLAFAGCIKENYFGKSSYKSILYFTVAHQSGTTIINEDSLLIHIEVDAQADLTTLYPDSILLSSYANVQPGKGAPQNFSAPVIYTVTAEDGSTAKYKVIATKQSSNPQISNSSFDDWYTPAGKSYQEPGLDANTSWATGNAGVVTLGAANTIPFTVSGTDLAARMITRDLGALSQITGQRMGAATIFTGSFVLDIANPINSTKFGIPFTASPKGFTVDYEYTPGTPYKNGNGNTLSKIDSCDIYLLLENRNGSTVKRVATGWFRSSTTVSSFTNLAIPLVYGALPSGTPAYQLPAGGLYANASEPVTHLTMVFASSANGAIYEGGVNSTLTVNNFQLTY